MKPQNTALLAGLLALCFASNAKAQQAAVPQDLPEACGSVFYKSAMPQIKNPKTAARTKNLCSGFYAVGFFSGTKTPLWSAEHLTSETVAAGKKIKRPDSDAFQPDKRLPEKDRSNLIDYKGSVKIGYDRGHMTPSADAPDMESREKTFLLSNMVPQSSNLNRGVWAAIEEQVRLIAEKTKSVYVVTGPAYVGKSFRWIGPDHVYVPTSTWKAVYVPSLHASGVYVCSNNVYKPVCSVMSASQLTDATGIDPFPNIEFAEKNNRLKLPQPEYKGN